MSKIDVTKQIARGFILLTATGLFIHAIYLAGNGQLQQAANEAIGALIVAACGRILVAMRRLSATEGDA